MKKLLLGLVLSAAVSCATATTANAVKVGKPQVSLAGTKWQMADYTKGKVPTLVIDGAKVSGDAPCNRYFGEIAINESTGDFDMKNIGSTRMACTSLDSETSYFKLLDEADKYVVSGNTLELYKGGLLLLKFNKIQ